MARVIGILGAAHCGSTALGLVLGGLPGVSFVGETHWLADRADPAVCRCGGGPGCPLQPHLPPPAGADWWQHFATALPGHTLVTSDKRPKHYDRFGLPDLAIILRRNREEWADSWCNKHHECATVGEARAVYDRLYPRAEKWCRRRGVPFVQVNWSAVIFDPQVQLPMLARRLGLKWCPAALSFAGRHYLGGYRDIGTELRI